MYSHNGPKFMYVNGKLRHRQWKPKFPFTDILMLFGCIDSRIFSWMTCMNHDHLRGSTFLSHSPYLLNLIWITVPKHTPTHKTRKRRRIEKKKKGREKEEEEERRNHTNMGLYINPAKRKVEINWPRLAHISLKPGWPKPLDPFLMMDWEPHKEELPSGETLGPNI